jgi:hypothetical protein
MILPITTSRRGPSLSIKYTSFSIAGWDILRLGRFCVGTFHSCDVLGLRTSEAWDVLDLGRYGVETFRGLGRFVTGTF